PGGIQLQGLRAGDGEADWVAVIRLVSSLIRDSEPTRLTLITDSTDPARLSAALPGVTVEVRMVSGTAVPNAALHASLRAIDAPGGKWRAEGRVAFSSGFAGSTTVTALVQPDGSEGFLQWGSVEVGPPGGVAAAPEGSTAATFALDLDLRVPSVVVLRLPDD